MNKTKFLFAFLLFATVAQLSAQSGNNIWLRAQGGTAFAAPAIASAFRAI